jgi:putative endonuclease
MTVNKISSGIFFYTYITTNPGKTVLYTGITNNLKRRIEEHFSNRGKNDHFASKYHCHKLIYYEIHETAAEAITREKEIKNMTRDRKLELIRTKNPKMNFLIV